MKMILQWSNSERRPRPGHLGFVSLSPCDSESCTTWKLLFSQTALVLHWWRHLGIFVCSEAASKVSRYRCFPVGCGALGNVLDFILPHFSLKTLKKNQERQCLLFRCLCTCQSIKHTMKSLSVPNVPVNHLLISLSFYLYLKTCTRLHSLNVRLCILDFATIFKVFCPSVTQFIFAVWFNQAVKH